MLNYSALKFSKMVEDARAEIAKLDRLMCRGVEFDEYPLPDMTSAMFEGFPTFAGVPEPTPEPQPALPAEVHHTQAFNESAAWEAVVALSRGV